MKRVVQEKIYVILNLALHKQYVGRTRNLAATPRCSNCAIAREVTRALLRRTFRKGEGTPPPANRVDLPRYAGRHRVERAGE